ncbi:MAG: geranylgeranylglycerol-phosphate geranylgeranyltransferase [Ignavibacteriae bacterium]|nr:geranylgeranylglycerol-phosphate geranylgeranyltransferase [Ignavibacteriota bacterium]
MKKFLAIIKISRPINFLITFIVVISSAIISSEDFYVSQNIFVAAFSASLIAAAGNIINDIFDFNIDLINRPERPLPANEISINFAIILYIIFTAGGLFLSYYISWDLFFIAISVSLILLLYSYLLKRIILLGNITIAFCTALAFIYGGVTVNNLQAAIIPALFAFLVNLIREIVKDVEDQKGDLENNIITFPLKFGMRSTKIILSFLIIVSILFTFYPFVNSIYKIEYFLIVLFSVNLILAYVLKLILNINFENKISQISNLLKLSMIFGLIAILFG